ncbi:MAG TPA: helix-turn-helix transcriptional regulator [Vicinamibacterales bacterium]|nr:helix-turn-helix transcriptional regulator [Vicinamibacterales bacterium]
MENFSYPIKLEPLSRPVKRRLPRTAQPLELWEARERNGVSLKTIADHTRIPLRHLEELERGDIDNWPAGVYARSWARDYAKEAGIDPDRVVAIVSPVAEVDPSIDEIREVREDAELKRADESPLAALVGLARKFAAVIVVLVLLVLAAVFFWSSDSRAANQADPAPVGTTGVAGQPGPQQPPR